MKRHSCGFFLLASLAGSALGQAPAAVESPAATPPAELVGPAFRFGDYDGDGQLDVYVVDPVAGDRLYQNQGDGTFADVSARVGLGDVRGSRQALWQDFDADGLLDLYVSASEGKSRLFKNNGEAGFADVTAAAGLVHRAQVELFAEWIDYDGDQLADLHVVLQDGDRLFHNQGRGTFEEVRLATRPSIDARVVALQLSGAGEFPATGAAGRGPTGPPGTNNSTQTGPHTAATATFCMFSVEDSSLPGNCLVASSVPTIGMLMPLSSDFNVSASGNVGIGTLTPGMKLDVSGNVRASGQVISSVATGTAPLAVSSATKVTNLNADTLDGVDSVAFSQLGSSIETGEIANLAVTNAKLAVGAVNSATILDASIASADLAAGAVTSTGLAAGSVTGLHLAIDAVTTTKISDFAVTGIKLAPDAVDTSRILNGTISSADLGTNSVTAAQIAAGAVGTTQIASLAVDGTKIADNSIGSAKIIDGSIGGPDITPTAVGNAALASNAVTSAKIADGTIVAADLAAGAVGSANLAVDAVTSVAIAPSAVGSSELAANAVDGSKISDGTIGGPDLTAGAVGPAALASGAVTSAKISDGTIVAADLAAGAVGTANLAVDSVTNVALAPSAVGTAELAANAVDGTKIFDSSISSEDIANGTILMADIGPNGASGGQVIKWSGTAWAPAADSTGLDSQWLNNGSSIYYNGGNVGLGTTAPGHPFHVVSAQQSPVTIEGSDLAGTWTGLRNTATGGDTWHLISTGPSNGEGAGKLVIRDNDTGTVAMTMQPDGLVGVGTAAPDGRMHVVNGSAGAVTAFTNSVLTIENNTNNFVSLLSPDASERGFLFGGPGHNYAGSIIYNTPLVPNGLEFRTNGNNSRMVVTGSGSVGINASSPSNQLAVGGGISVDANNANAGSTFSALHFGGAFTGEAIGSRRDFGAGSFGLDFYTSSLRRMFIKSDGNVGIGVNDPTERLDVAGATRTQCVKITGGCDLAEPFEFSDLITEPGMVMCINPEQDGKLRIATRAYDTTVAGVISGAGGVKAGMTMSQEDVLDQGSMVALAGRVYCWCDAARGAIRPGDLLTSSDTAGHAMKVSDRTLASGAIIGKALTSLSEGRGLVLMVVTLQ